jgi:hypothetical protein
MPCKLDNSEMIEGIFGSWPTFHDFEILSICLDRRAVGMSIRILAWTDRGEAYYEVVLRFDGIEDLVLEDFNHQNVMFGLDLSQVEDRIKVEIDSVFGARCAFTCHRGSVVSVEETTLLPGLSARPSTTGSR